MAGSVGGWVGVDGGWGKSTPKALVITADIMKHILISSAYRCILESGTTVTSFFLSCI